MKKYLIYTLIVFIIGFSACSFHDKKQQETKKKAQEAEEIKTIYFEQENTSELNYFQHINGDFSFYYPNNFEVKKFQDIYYVQSATSKEPYFLIFLKNSNIQYKKGILCAPDYCFNANNQGVVFNLSFEKFSKERDLTPITRREALIRVIDLAYPNDDFSIYTDCFSDENDPRICFAKEKGIVKGIRGEFHGELSVNLWGFLKFLFKAFEINDFDFDQKYLENIYFEKFSKNHVDYDLISKAFYEGIFDQIEKDTIWANKTLFREDISVILDNFLTYKDGEALKDYKKPEKASELEPVYIRDDLVLSFEESNGFNDDEYINAQLEQSENGVDIYYKINNGIYFYLYNIEGVRLKDIEYAKLNVEFERFDFEIKVKFNDGKILMLKNKIPRHRFAEFKDIDSSREIEFLSSAALLPNQEKAPNGDILRLRIYTENKSFEDFFLNRESNQRKRAYLEMLYPNGDVRGYSILLKTRGNSSRSYIKQSFTIESFKDFAKTPSELDEFIEDRNEFKLRSLISDETRMQEKVMYTMFNDLGNPAPDYTPVMVDLNGVQMGMYQMTEAIKKHFFHSRNINYDYYFYAKNIDSIYPSNLSFQKDKATTLENYKIKKEPDALLDLIDALDRKDPDLINSINKQNIFDYAFLLYLSDAYDSLTHNFYVYMDSDTEKWGFAMWDADIAFIHANPVDEQSFLNFVRQRDSSYNNLIYYTFENMTNDELSQYFQRASDILHKKDYREMIRDFRRQYGDFADYNHRLWQGKYLQRKNYADRPEESIKRLRSNLDLQFFKK
ncbi:MAG: CotH kinase family protein [Candidatus Gracilibacteria bacterium]|jgi:hypothetical protein|nr:CotH kinase family protein [Candidatus Gracilibacteria bacterium]